MPVPAPVSAHVSDLVRRLAHTEPSAVAPSEREAVIEKVLDADPKLDAATVREALIEAWAQANERGRAAASSGQIADGMPSLKGARASISTGGPMSPVGARLPSPTQVVEAPRTQSFKRAPDINYARNVDMTGRTTVRPTTLDELQAAIHDNPFVRAAGRGHSFNGSIVAEKEGEKATVVDLTALNGATVHTGPKPEDNFCWVEGGCTITRLNELLEAQGIEMRTSPMHPDVTVGGSLATASHGVGQGVSNWGDEVLEMEVLDAKGVVRTITDPDELAAHRVALGSMGIIWRVKLRCQKIRPMRTDEEKFDEVSARQRYANWMNDHDRVDMFLFMGERPGQGQAMVRRSDYIDAPDAAGRSPAEQWENEKRSTLDKAVGYLEEHVAGTIGATALMTSCTLAEEIFGRSVGNWVREGVRDFSAWGLRENEFADSSHALNHRFPGHTRVETAQWAIPMDKLDEALDMVYASCRETNFSPNMPVYVRNLKASEGTLLGMNAGTPRVMVEVYSHHTDETPVDFYRTLERKLRAIDGRPHLAKLMWDSPADLWPDKNLDKFQQLRAAFDPTGKFNNQFTEGFFFSRKAAEATLPRPDFEATPGDAPPSSPLLRHIGSTDKTDAQRLDRSLRQAWRDAGRLRNLRSEGKPFTVTGPEAANQADRLRDLAATIGAAKADYLAHQGKGTKSPAEVFYKCDLPLRALNGLLNDFAAMAQSLGTVEVDGTRQDLGLQVMRALCHALHGDDATVMRTGGGDTAPFALWSVSDHDGPAKVATLPSNAELSTYAVREAATTAAPPVGLGALDQAKLSQSTSMAHFREAFGRDATVGELAQMAIDGDDIEMKARPDPTEALRRAHEAGRDAAITDPAELSLLTYNVALLDVEPFERQLNDWVGHRVAHGISEALAKTMHKTFNSPNLDKRREVLADRIFGQNQDVVMLQEVWRDEDVAHFTEVAEANGYQVMVGPRVARPGPDGDDPETGYNDGLMTCVKKSVIEEGSEVGERKRAYRTQDSIEYTVGAVKRGYQEVSFEHKDLGPVHLFNTHAQAYADKFDIRMAQSRELGLAMRAASDDDGLVLGGGDLNAAPYYAHDKHRKSWLNTVDSYFENSLSHWMLMHYAGAKDAALMGRPSHDATADVSRMHDLPDTAEWPYTATEHNGLYKERYDVLTKSDRDGARIDHLFGIGRFQAKDTNLAFTDVDAEAGSELSDHFGVVTTVVGQRRSA